jgi:outer membrane immunogenic protein
MKNTIYAPLAFLLSVAAASAADLPARKTPEFLPPPPVFLFEGFYVGAQAGVAGFGDRAQSLFAPNNAVLYSRTGRGGSFIGGVHAGYDWSWCPIVYGLVGDISGARARAYTTDAFFGYGVQNTIDGQGSFRGRVGLNYASALLYVTGGLEVAHIERAYQAPLGSMTTNWWSVTPTVGVGVEYAFDPLWSAHVEFRTFGGRTRAEAANFAQPALETRHAQGEGMVTAGVSYRFGR